MRRPDETIFIVPRDPPARTTVVLSALGLVLVVLLMLRLRGPLIGALMGTFVISVQWLGVSLVRQARMMMSRDAYTAQLWLSPEGIGFVADADREPLGKLIEYTWGLVVSVSLYLAIFYGEALRHPVVRR